MKINIASSGGRFHLLDLARELRNNGHEVHFYSFVPSKRAKRYGLQPECDNNYSLIYIPFHILLLITKRAHWALYLFHRFFDVYTALFMKPCDILIVHSPMHVFAIKYAKKRYGAKVIIERGTSHVLTQIEVLRQNPLNKNKDVMPKMFLKRDLLGYELADYISVASEHVYKSFVENGIPPYKLFKNPYGVNLSNFYPTKLNESGRVYDVLMVGQWCHRKGCDLLYKACQELNVSLLHVGSIIDLPFIETSNFTHRDAVDEIQLRNFYKSARIFVLPSREEGLAMVQPQAMVCGLPLVCSLFSGGKDLREMLPEENRKWVIIVENLSIKGVKRGIHEGLMLASQQEGIRNYVGNFVERLTWKAYGERYNMFIKKIIK